jgi:bifunctional non-homologous end joining protein LigD
MLATLFDQPAAQHLRHERWIYEVKYDGMRVLASVEPAEPLARVSLRSRAGNDKTSQFPDLVAELRRFARGLRRPVLLDGEVVALDARGEPLGFQQLAGRIHLTAGGEIEGRAATVPVAFIAFDILRDGAEDLRPLPLVDRKARLERVFGNEATGRVRMSEMAAGDGHHLHARVAATQGEGLVAKDVNSPYESGRRSPAWRKLKIVRRQDFLVCGWTMPRQSRQHFGSLVLGYWTGTGAARVLQHAGTVGSGFTGEELRRVMALLQPLADDACPFPAVPPTPEPARWVRPVLVAAVRFAEWTAEGVLRHPVYLGLREDVDPGSVTREAEPPGTEPPGAEPERLAVAPKVSSAAAVRARTLKGRASVGATRAPRRTAGRARPAARAEIDAPAVTAIIEQVQALEDARRNGVLALPGGTSLAVTNLHKVFWPASGRTKGDLLRHYARVSPWLLPALDGRPLVMKRYPNGVTGKAFYQQRAPEDAPPGVRVEMLDEDDGPMPRLVGGDHATLLYVAQLGAISQDPWFSRVGTRSVADYVALDLDPMPGVPFAQVLEVARAIRDALLALEVPAVAKTSGSSGLHVYIPLLEGTTYEAGQLFCQIVATFIAERHPRIATVERAVAKRGRTVYVDYLQNIEGKTLASVYSARSSEFAGVSTPLAWNELDEEIAPQDFTLDTVAARYRRVGDLWAPVVAGPRADLRVVLDRLARWPTRG